MKTVMLIIYLFIILVLYFILAIYIDRKEYMRIKGGEQMNKYAKCPVCGHDYCVNCDIICPVCGSDYFEEIEKIKEKEIAITKDNQK